MWELIILYTYRHIELHLHYFLYLDYSCPLEFLNLKMVLEEVKKRDNKGHDANVEILKICVKMEPCVMRFTTSSP